MITKTSTVNNIIIDPVHGTAIITYLVTYSDSSDNSVNSVTTGNPKVITQDNIDKIMQIING